MRAAPASCRLLLLALTGAALPCAGQTFHGTVIDELRGVPVAQAEVVVEGEDYPRLRTDAAGRFQVDVEGGTARLTIRRPGYFTWRGEVPDDAPGGEIRLVADPFRMEGIQVQSRALGTAPSLQPAAVLGERQLAERMSASIAAALVREPGVTIRTNGPMASQPVIRGLSGDRVLVLEDGVRVGDISTTAPDHAITIEPATAREVEVIRGPAGLLHGSNSLGGVVNVRREDVPRSPTTATEWALSATGESVNRGGSASGRVRGGAGPVSLHLDGAARAAGDTRTPGGIPLPFTDLETFDGGVGVSLAGESGHIGGALRAYRAAYGVPSSYEGVTLPGSHDGGVYIDVERTSGRVDGEWRSSRPGPLEALAFGANAVRFEQWEYEEGGFVGTRFGQLAASAEAVARLRGAGHRGALGLAGHWKDLRAEGSFTGTRPAQARSIALFAVEEFQLGGADVLAGVRYDRITIVPLDSTETLLVQNIRTRSFDALTGAVGLRAPLRFGWSGSVQVARAFRPPSIEELFSAGPHLASYAYEIGLPSLAPEHGLGFDLLLERRGERGMIEVAAFAMRVDGFIGFEPMVDEESGLPLRDPRLRRYVVYAPVQRDARLAGVEIRTRLLPAEGWSVELSADFVRGRAADGGVLPSMPPGSTRVELRRRWGALEIALDAEGRMPVRRTPPGPPGADAGCVPEVVDGEASVLPSHFCPTPGVALLGAVASVELERFGLPRGSRILLAFENLLDTRWQDPLWRAKQVAPQPGRNIRLGLRITP